MPKKTKQKSMTGGGLRELEERLKKKPEYKKLSIVVDKFEGEIKKVIESKLPNDIKILHIVQIFIDFK